MQNSGKSPVVVYGHKNPYMIICFLACLLSGRAYVPCDTFTPLLRIKYIITETGSELTILTEILNEKDINAINPDELRADLQPKG